MLDTIQHIELFDLCKQLDNASIDMILCDLPYGVTANSWDNVIPIAPMWVEFMRVIKPKGAIVLTATQPFASDLISANRTHFKYEWIWRKSRGNGFLLAKKMPMRQHENVLVFSATSPNYYPQMIAITPRKKDAIATSISGNYSKDLKVGRGITKITDEKYPSSVIDFTVALDESEATTKHPTQKPLELWQYLIKTYTQEGDIVLDPCVGSGTTAMACHLLNRRYICGDTSAEYVELARNRVANCDPLKPKVVGNYKQASLFEGD